MTRPSPSARPAFRLGLTVAAVFFVLTPIASGAQEFGSQVRIVGGEIYVSEPTTQESPAIVRRYRQGGDGWTEVAQIRAPAHESPTDYFGRTLVMDDRSMLVGGTLYQNSTGAVWAFRRDGQSWAFDQMLQPDSIAEGGAFGRFGHLNGDFFFISSLGFRSVGAVWVYRRDASGRWQEEARLDPENPAPEEFFGWGMDFDGDRLIVGSLAGQVATGAAYVFVRDAAGEWTQEARLALSPDEARQRDASLPPGPGAATIGVGWFQGMALLGLPGRNLGEGAVYTFRRHPVTEDWILGTTLSAFDRQMGAGFGHKFLVRNDELWVSAPGEGVGGSIYSFAYDPVTRSFGQASKIRNTIAPEVGDAFGFALAAAGDLAVVGQSGDDSGLGSAIVLRLRNGEWAAETQLLVPPAPGLPAIAGGQIPCGTSGTADQFTCSNVTLLSFLPLDQIGAGRGAQGNDIWGWTDPTNGREYAIAGRTDGTAFIDITDPVNPRYLGSLPKTPGTTSEAWRDIKVFRDHAFVVADGAGQHGIQVFDLTRLRGVSGPETFTPDVVYEGIASAHNIVINEETGTAFAVGANMGGEPCSGGLHMVDINDPRNPTFLGCFAHQGTGRAGNGYTHDAMCTLYRGPDAEHAGREICFSSNETHLSIADVTDKRNPVALSSATYPNAAYTHQGWITEDHRYFYTDDELDEDEAERAGNSMPGTRTLIWDVTDLDDPVLVKEHFGEALTIDHNLYIRGNLMYQSNYESGLRILSIADPENPVEVGFFDTVPWSQEVSFNGSWSNYPYFASGTIVLGSRREGVFFVRYTPRELLP